ARDVLPGAALGTVGLDAEELLLVVPFEERARLVQAFVALESDQVGRKHLGQHLAELGLARARRALGEERLLERERQEERRLDARRGDVAGGAEPLADLVEGHAFTHISTQARDA